MLTPLPGGPTCHHPQDCLGLGTIIAATDSVATLQVLSQERFPLLYSMVFGEGVLNDATSVVILSTIQALNLQEARDVTAGIIGLVFLDFLYLFVLSLILGAVCGLITAFLLRRFHFEHTAHEVALIGMTAYLSYLLGDVLQLSGILALFVCAVTTSHYALHNISSQSRTTTIYAFQTLSYVSEGIIFVYCGMDALDPLKWKVQDLPMRLAAGRTVVFGIVLLSSEAGCRHLGMWPSCRTPTSGSCCGCSGSSSSCCSSAVRCLWCPSRCCTTERRRTS